MIRTRLIFGLACAAILIIIVSSLTGCVESREENFLRRLDDFRSQLPEPIRADFDAGNYDTAVQEIDSALAVDGEFAARWKNIKSAEAIDLFTTAEVVDYFKDYFVTYRESR